MEAETQAEGNTATEETTEGNTETEAETTVEAVILRPSAVAG